VKLRLLSLTVVLSGLAAASIIFVAGCSKDENSTGPEPTDTTFTYIFDDDIQPGDSVHLTADTRYLFSGLVFVDSGAVLSVEAGTVLRFRPGVGVNSSALIVARHGKIYMNGTATAPIIMTAQADDIDVANDIQTFAKGLWGGLIILGNAPNNNAGGEGQIEGISSDELRAAHGGDNPHDNSGVIRYVSIRHGGTEIGAGNEINGLTLGSVGDGTTIEYVEVFSNQDDGVEFFGGLVNTRYIAVAFCGDDCYDYDEGFLGQGQFWLGIQSSDDGNHCGEFDGATGNEQSEPFAIPVISNATFLGSGENAPNQDNDNLIILRDNAGGKFHNSIFYDFAGNGLLIEDQSETTHPEDSRARLEAGDMVFMNNIWYGFGNGNNADQIWNQDFVLTYMTTSANHNDIVNPEMISISRTANGGLDPRPTNGSPAAAGAVMPGGSFFTTVTYKGAFDPSAPSWLEGWTALSAYGFTQ